MSGKDKFSFEACVVCEYTRQWETHRLFQTVGKLMDSALSELMESKRIFAFGYDEEFESTFSLEHYYENSMPDWLEKELDKGNTKQQHHIFRNGYLVFLADVTVTKDQYQNALKNADGSPVDKDMFTDDQLIDIYKDFVVGELDSYAFLFSLAANIAKPGAFQFSERYLFQNQSLIRKAGGTLNLFDRAFEISDKYSWPPITELEVLEVWDWVIEVPGFVQGETKTKLGRALGALSYLLNDMYKDANDLALVWALVGLESLYGKSNVGLKVQLLEKTEAFLGKRSSHKKVFGDMYDFRSRLIHGDKNFHYQGYDGVLEEEFSDKLAESERLAITTLISTLQKMCVNQMLDLDFKIVTNI